MADINKISKVLTPESLCEVGELTNEDYNEFVRWLLECTTNPTIKDIDYEICFGLQKICLARWHLYLAPDDVVVPMKSMLPTPVYAPITLSLSIHTSWTRCP